MILAIEIYSMLLFYNIILYAAILSYQFVKKPFETIEILDSLEVFTVISYLLIVFFSLPINLITFVQLVIVEIKD